MLSDILRILRIIPAGTYQATSAKRRPELLSTADTAPIAHSMFSAGRLEGSFYMRYDFFYHAFIMLAHRHDIENLTLFGPFYRYVVSFAGTKHREKRENNSLAKMFLTILLLPKRGRSGFKSLRLRAIDAWQIHKKAMLEKVQELPAPCLRNR